MTYTVSVDPKAGRWSLGRIAFGMVTAWAVAGLLCDGYLGYRAASWHPVPVTSTVSPDPSLTGGALVLLLLQITWLLSLSVLVPAAVLGLMHLRRGQEPLGRIATFLAVIAIGGVGTLWSLLHGPAYGLVLVIGCWLSALALLRTRAGG